MATMLSAENHDWTKRLKGDPGSLGFSTSYMSVEGIQNPPYVFFRAGRVEEKDLKNYTFWERGSHNMPEGESMIRTAGEGASDWDSTAYNMILVEETRKFLNRHLRKQADKPFFSYVALGAVHAPHSPPYNYTDGSPVAGQYDTKHMDIIFEMDKVVGSLIKLLEEKKLVQDTIIIFTSDNGGLGRQYGDFSSGPLRQAKGSIYEGGHRIPMTIRWDKGNIPSGEKRSQVIGLNDLFATLCDLAGVEIPVGQAVDSVSFADNIFDEDSTEGQREYLGTWMFRDRNFIAQAIRKEEMKLVHKYNENVFELYNLTADISETNDISEDNQELVEQMFEKLKELSPCYDNVGRFNVYIPWLEQKVKKKCEFFAKKLQRCHSFPEGRLNCRLTCGSPSDIKWCRKSPLE